MIKSEALKFIKEKLGYVPYKSMFDVFEENEIIPQQLIDYCSRKTSAPGTFMIIDAKNTPFLKEALGK